MKGNRFFDLFLDNIEKFTQEDLKNFVHLMDKERRTLKQIINSLEEGLIVINTGEIVFMNQIARQTLIVRQLSLPVSLKQVPDFIVDQYLFQKIQNILAQNAGIFQVHVPHPLNNQYRYFNIEHSIPEKNFSIIRISDQTTEKQLEFEVKDLKSVGALNNLAAGIAHEIKNPLTAIDLHTQIIKKGIEKNLISVPEEILNYISIIDEEGKRLNKIVNDFLLSTRKRKLKLTFEDIQEFMVGILKLVEPELNENHIQTKLNFKEIPKIFIDKNYLKQAILNLIKNSIEAMHHQKEKILTLTLFYDLGRDAVAICIKDTGCGIKEELLQNVFDPYYTSKENGTGLGLTIVYKIIREHSGEIQVESKADIGTRFSIYLPVTRGTKLISNQDSERPCTG